MISRTSRVTASIARRLVASRRLRQFIPAGLGLVLLAATGGCASITNGTSQGVVK